MARKKSSQRKTARPQEFSHSPFEPLKGLSASRVPRSPKSPAPQAEPAGGQSDNASAENRFAEEMSFLGVKPLPGRVIAPPGSDQEESSKTPVGSEPSRQEQDKTDFLAAVGGMSTTFSDAWPEESPARHALPRRMKQVERGQLRLEAELDLHGLTVDEAVAKVRFFLQNATFQGFQAVLIITGRGLHSSDGPVLRETVTKLLGQLREQVLEWGLAPRRYGGDGALVVFLRRQI